MIVSNEICLQVKRKSFIFQKKHFIWINICPMKSIPFSHGDGRNLDKKFGALGNLSKWNLLPIFETVDLLYFKFNLNSKIIL